jgi:hypothetical protein
MKVLVLVMSCDIDRYPVLVAKQRETWDSVHVPGVSTVYYYAGHKTKLVRQRLNINIQEGTGYFYYKTILAFKEMLRQDWDYIFKTDNSAYVNKAALYSVLENKPRQNFYGGHLYQTAFVKSDPFLWGEGMVFSRDVVQYLVDDYDISSVGRSGVEDVHIGMILKEPFNKKVVWDTSLTIPEYHKLQEIPLSHVYRCKDDKTGDVKSTLSAMDNIHQFLHPELSPQPM